MSDQQQSPASVAPALLDAAAAAAFCSVSLSFWHKLRRTGRVPDPIRLGSAVRWRRIELGEWINSGCPRPDDCKDDR